MMGKYLKVGQAVFVSFEACSRTEVDGHLFSGHGVIECLSDGCCYGKISTGQPFCCPVEYVKPADKAYKAPSEIELFIEYIKTDPDYRSLINIHGKALFNRDGDSFRVLAIRLAYRLWKQQRAKSCASAQDLERFNVILILFFSGIVITFAYYFGVIGAINFASNCLVLAVALCALGYFFKRIMSKNINE